LLADALEETGIAWVGPHMSRCCCLREPAGAVGGRISALTFSDPSAAFE
jgi:hypothetical protein